MRSMKSDNFVPTLLFLKKRALRDIAKNKNRDDNLNLTNLSLQCFKYAWLDQLVGIQNLTNVHLIHAISGLVVEMVKKCWFVYPWLFCLVSVHKEDLTSLKNLKHFGKLYRLWLWLAVSFFIIIVEKIFIDISWFFRFLQKFAKSKFTWNL